MFKTSPLHQFILHFMHLNDSLLGKRPNKHQKKFQNKQVLAKKKRYHEKAFGLPKNHEVNEQYFLENDIRLSWLVFEIIPTLVGKIIHCLSKETGEIRIIPLGISSTGIPLVIGDRIIIEKNILCGILKRKNLLSRQKGDSARFSLHTRVSQSIAANIDFVVIVASAKDPKFQPGFIDRYLLLALSCNITVIICISKSDLIQLDDPILAWYEKTLKITVVYTSSNTQEGIDELKNYITGKIVVFVGKSGVGKSSLVNTVLGKEVAPTSLVSEKGGQGQHTTTAFKMHQWSSNSFIVDTPGIRSLDFLEFTKTDILMYFPEFDIFAKNCRYRDCLHIEEADCGIKEAVISGIIPELRYSTYLRLMKEAV